jgi:DNA-binding MarR family transcriptional regulator
MTTAKSGDARRKRSREATPQRNSAQLSAPLRGLLTMKMIIVFGLLRRSGVLAQRRLFDLSELEWRIVTQVAAYGPVSLNGLAEALVQDRGQLSRVVKAMVGRGFLTRERKPGGPGIVIELSKDGEGLYHQMVDWALERDDMLTGDTPPEEVATLRRTLDRMADKARVLLAREREAAGAAGGEDE